MLKLQYEPPWFCSGSLTDLVLSLEMPTNNTETVMKIFSILILLKMLQLITDMLRNKTLIEECYIHYTEQQNIVVIAYNAGFIFILFLFVNF